MNAAARLGGFAVALAGIFAVALATGRGAGPIGAGQHASAISGAPRPVTGVTGLAASAGGFTLRPASTALRVGAQQFSFVIVAPDGRPLRSYAPTHERDLHLVVVRRDLASFQHLHPTQDSAGRWSVAMTLPSPGPYRVFADFAPEGQAARTLGIDVSVPGAYAPAGIPAPQPIAEVDGYVVTRQGRLTAGEASELSFAVSRGGIDVPDLQPYLGAYGHLVVLRESDLAYLHVHPEDTDGGTLRFTTTVPTEGAYRAFLDFRHGDVVRTANWPLVADATSDRGGSEHGH